MLRLLRARRAGLRVLVRSALERDALEHLREIDLRNMDDGVSRRRVLRTSGSRRLKLVPRTCSVKTWTSWSSTDNASKCDVVCRIVEILMSLLTLLSCTDWLLFVILTHCSQTPDWTLKVFSFSSICDFSVDTSRFKSSVAISSMNSNPV